jgi:hypothetical protein
VLTLFGVLIRHASTIVPDVDGEDLAEGESTMISVLTQVVRRDRSAHTLSLSLSIVSKSKVMRCRVVLER